MPVEVLRLAALSRHPGCSLPRQPGQRAGLCPSVGPGDACGVAIQRTEEVNFVIAALGALNPARPFGCPWGPLRCPGLVLSCLCMHVAAPGTPTPTIFITFL